MEKKPEKRIWAVRLFVKYGEMSRIGKKPIVVPEGVTAKIEKRKIKILGPKGELELDLPEFIGIKEKENQLLVFRQREDKKTKSNHGTIRNLINNMILGVIQGWEKKLEVVGTGYQVNLEDENLVFKLGFSHPVVFNPPKGIKFEVEENKIKVLGISKELVGNIAAQIRRIKPPDSYQGKGIRYSGEKIKLKPGKAAKVGTAEGS